MDLHPRRDAHFLEHDLHQLGVVDFALGFLRDLAAARDHRLHDFLHDTGRAATIDDFGQHACGPHAAEAAGGLDHLHFCTGARGGERGTDTGGAGADDEDLAVTGDRNRTCRLDEAAVEPEFTAGTHNFAAGEVGEIPSRLGHSLTGEGERVGAKDGAGGGGVEEVAAAGGTRGRIHGGRRKLRVA